MGFIGLGSDSDVCTIFRGTFCNGQANAAGRPGDEEGFTP
jgi:hypothetical protein